jgi:hypothetical protein
MGKVNRDDLTPLMVYSAKLWATQWADPKRFVGRPPRSPFLAKGEERLHKMIALAVPAISDFGDSNDWAKFESELARLAVEMNRFICHESQDAANGAGHLLPIVLRTFGYHTRSTDPKDNLISAIATAYTKPHDEQVAIVAKAILKRFKRPQ